MEDEPLLCMSCFARSTEDHFGWEASEFGTLCPECVQSDVFAEEPTVGMQAIAEALRLAKK